MMEAKVDHAGDTQEGTVAPPKLMRALSQSLEKGVHKTVRWCRRHFSDVALRDLSVTKALEKGKIQTRKRSGKFDRERKISSWHSTYDKHNVKASKLW